MDIQNTHHVPQGFQAAGIHCGLKTKQAKDIALIVSEAPCQVVGAFTTNQVKAAPVIYDQEIITGGNPVRAVVINAGNANACTGSQGVANTQAMAKHTAAVFQGQPDEVLVMSTGVIGVQLPIDMVIDGIEEAGKSLRQDGWVDASQAIMTTDTKSKIVSLQTKEGYNIIGIAKGSGMIAPHLATMLVVIATDANLSAEMISQIPHLWDQSFNRIVVDGDMSTNDTVLLLANGTSGITASVENGFETNLNNVCTALAKAIVGDGEGATKLVNVSITGSETEEDAEKIARAIATSPLCKTAFYGSDPNWGRFICAAGYAGVDLQIDHLVLWLRNKEEKIKLFEHSLPAAFDEAAAIDLMNGKEWTVELNLGMGDKAYWLWTCDLSHDYITINGHYRT